MHITLVWNLPSTPSLQKILTSAYKAFLPQVPSCCDYRHAPLHWP